MRSVTHYANIFKKAVASSDFNAYRYKKGLIEKFLYKYSKKMFRLPCSN